MDPAMAGDPAAAGAPPMDPAMAGGMPPMDPMMAGGDPMAMPPPDAGDVSPTGEPYMKITPTQLSKLFKQFADHNQCRRLAHVVSLRFERQSPHGDGLALQALAFEGPLQLLEEDALLSLVDALHSLQHLHGVSVLVGRLDECFHVLGEAAAAISAAGIEELAANARVRAYACAYHINICAHALAKVGDIVHE